MGFAVWQRFSLPSGHPAFFSRPLLGGDWTHTHNRGNSAHTSLQGVATFHKPLTPQAGESRHETPSRRPRTQQAQNPRTHPHHTPAQHTMPPAGPGIQSSKPEKVDASVVNVKGHDYYKDEFVPPQEVVTEIDPRDKVSWHMGYGLRKYLSWSVTCITVGV